MRLLRPALLKDLRLLWRDRLGLALWIAIPVSILTLMSLVFGGSSSTGPKPRGTLFVADLDDSFASRLVSSAFSQGPLGELFNVEKTSEPDGRARMAKGKGSALIVLPAGLQDRVLNNQPVAISLLTNPSQRILPAIASESLNMLSESVHYLHLVAGNHLQSIASRKTTPSEAEVAATSVAISRTIKDLSAYLDPLLLDIAYEQPNKTPQPAQTPFNPARLLFPGMLFMTILFVARGSSDSIWDEVHRGTLRRWHASGNSLLPWLASRLLATCLLAFIVAALAVAAGAFLLGLPSAGWTAAILWITTGAAFWYLVMLLLQSAAGSERRGEVLTSFVLFPSMMLGGSLFSFSMMPDSLAAIGRLTPLGFMVAQLEQILPGRATAAHLALAFSSLAALSAVLFFFSAWFLRRKFLRG